MQYVAQPGRCSQSTPQNLLSPAAKLGTPHERRTVYARVRWNATRTVSLSSVSSSSRSIVACHEWPVCGTLVGRAGCTAVQQEDCCINFTGVNKGQCDWLKHEGVWGIEVQLQSFLKQKLDESASLALLPGRLYSGEQLRNTHTHTILAEETGTTGDTSQEKGIILKWAAIYLGSGLTWIRTNISGGSLRKFNNNSG